MCVESGRAHSPTTSDAWPPVKGGLQGWSLSFRIRKIPQAVISPEDSLRAHPGGRVRRLVARTGHRAVPQARIASQGDRRRRCQLMRRPTWSCACCRRGGARCPPPCRLCSGPRPPWTAQAAACSSQGLSQLDLALVCHARALQAWMNRRCWAPSRFLGHEGSVSSGMRQGSSVGSVGEAGQPRLRSAQF